MNTSTYSLAQFVQDVRRIVAARPEPRAQAMEVARRAEDLLADPESLRPEAERAREEKKRRHLLYEDPETGFQVLLHYQPPGQRGRPHNHGPCWVVYGVYENLMGMTRYQRLDGGKQPGVARLKPSRDYVLERGEVNFFLPGDIHSTHNPGASPSLVLRVTQKNLSRISREHFDPEHDRVYTE